MRPFFTDAYDASTALGLPVTLGGHVLGLRCDRCVEFAVAGSQLEAAAQEALIRILALDRRLSGIEARFLRKTGIGISARALASRLGVSPAEVERWEASRSLDAEHDLLLRGLVTNELLPRWRTGDAQIRRRRAELLRELHKVRGVRRREAPARVPVLRIIPTAA